jgi:hypothetical protein
MSQHNGMDSIKIVFSFVLGMALDQVSWQGDLKFIYLFIYLSHNTVNSKTVAIVNDDLKRTRYKAFVVCFNVCGIFLEWLKKTSKLSG